MRLAEKDDWTLWRVPSSPITPANVGEMRLMFLHNELDKGWTLGLSRQLVTNVAPSTVPFMCYRLAWLELGSETYADETEVPEELEALFAHEIAGFEAWLRISNLWPADHLA